MFLAADEMRIPIRKLFPVGSCVALLIGLVGCVSTQVHVSGQAPAGVGSDEGIAFVFFNTFSSDEDDFFDCTSEGIRDASPTVKIIPPHEFRRIAFPHLAPEDALSTAEHYALDHIMRGWPGGQEQREQLLQAGIRYVISIDAWTTQDGREPWGGGIAGYPCCPVWLWGKTWDRYSQITAEILDLKEKRQVGTVQAESSGTPWTAVIIWLPIGAPAFTETGLCGDLGDDLAKFLAGETTPASSDSGHAKDD